MITKINIIDRIGWRLLVAAFFTLQWPMVNGQRSMVNGQRSMVNGQRSMVNGQRSMVNGQRSIISAQTVTDLIKNDPSYAACNYRVYPDSVEMPMTPPPAGKHPFYISHYGRHGSRYINNRKGYDVPYKMMLRADSLGQLTPTGHDVLKEIELIIADTEGQWGDLTGFGMLQLRHIARRMTERFPEVLSGDARVDAKSTVVTRCMLSMGTFLMEMAKINPELRITMRASKRDMWYMNHQDKLLRKDMPEETEEAYNKFVAKYSKNRKLMNLLFTDPDSASTVVDETRLNYYIIKMGLFQLNTHFYQKTFLTDLFEAEDLYRLWKTDNVWWYLNYGSSELNDGDRPYTQRYLLRQIIADADSCMQLERPGIQLRFGHETVLLPLTCLIGINGYDKHITDWEDIEAEGWLSSSVFPMASNLQFIFYRSDINDQDVLFKVLLNEQEAQLPIKTDCAPYYHWNDFRAFYLDKLDRYDEKRKALGQ